MTRGRNVAAALGLVLSAIVLLVWVMPVVVGPTFECVDTEPATCEDIWRARVESDRGLLFGSDLEQFFPVTKVRIWDGGCQTLIEHAYGLLGTYSIC